MAANLASELLAGDSRIVQARKGLTYEHRGVFLPLEVHCTVEKGRRSLEITLIYAQERRKASQRKAAGGRTCRDLGGVSPVADFPLHAARGLVPAAVAAADSHSRNLH